jgi:hypothetical protein
MPSGISIFAMTFWSFRERVEVGNWKRYKIGDSVVVARRFRKIPFNPLPSRPHALIADSSALLLFSLLLA